MKTLATIVALATLIASPAFAQSPKASGAVSFGNKYVGQDPDAGIRSQLLREFMHETRPGTIEDGTIIRESDLPRHFENGKENQPKQPGRTEGDTMNPANPPDEKGGKPPKDDEAANMGKPGKDLQLDKAIDLLKNWDKGQIAKLENDRAAASASAATPSADEGAKEQQ